MEYIYDVGSVESEEYHYFRLELKLEEKAVDRLENTSTVAYRLRLYAGARYFYGYGLGAQLSLGGVPVAMRDREREPAVSIEKNGYLDILQGETTLTHNPDGSLQTSVAFAIDMTAGYYTPGPMSGAGELTLTTISRASRIRGTAAHIGQVSMLAITRYSPDFTHSVKYTFGSRSGYLTAEGDSTQTEVIFDAISLGFLLPESFYYEIPQSAAGTCHLEITTYSDGERIGAEVADFTVSADPAAVAPEARFSAGDVRPETLALTGDPGRLILGQSQVQCQVDAQGREGAQIVAVEINGKPDLVFLAQTPVLELAVTDSRGFVTRKTLTLEAVDYTTLTCNLAAQRTDPTSGRVLLQVWGQCFTGSFGLQENRLRLSCMGVEIPCTCRDQTYQGEVILEDLSYQSAHTLQILAEDLLSQVERQTTVNRGVPVFDWGHNDFVFHVPVTAEQGVNGVYLGSFTGSSLWLTPVELPQSYFIAGALQGALTVTPEGCAWQGTEGVTALTAGERVGLVFDRQLQGVILSDQPIR